MSRVRATSGADGSRAATLLYIERPWSVIVPVGATSTTRSMRAINEFSRALRASRGIAVVYISHFL